MYVFELYFHPNESILRRKLKSENLKEYKCFCSENFEDQIGLTNHCLKTGHFRVSKHPKQLGLWKKIKCEITIEKKTEYLGTDFAEESDITSDSDYSDDDFSEAFFEEIEDDFTEHTPLYSNKKSGNSSVLNQIDSGTLLPITY